jgi:hypothetical protein
MKKNIICMMLLIVSGISVASNDAYDQIQGIWSMCDVQRMMRFLAIDTAYKGYDQVGYCIEVKADRGTVYFNDIKNTFAIKFISKSDSKYELIYNGKSRLFYLKKIPSVHENDYIWYFDDSGNNSRDGFMFYFVTKMTSQYEYSVKGCLKSINDETILDRTESSVQSFGD